MKVEDRRGSGKVVDAPAVGESMVLIAAAVALTFVFAFPFALSAASMRLHCHVSSGSMAEHMSEVGGSTMDAEDIPSKAYEGCCGRAPPNGTSCLL